MALELPTSNWSSSFPSGEPYHTAFSELSAPVGELRYTKCLPSGRKDGHRWLVSCSCSLVTSRGAPPCAGTIDSGPVREFENTMSPFFPHVPPRASAAEHTVRGVPPFASTLRKFPSAKKATKIPSGDQNGYSAPSVFGTSRGSSESKDWIYSAVCPPSPAIKAKRVPSGEGV